MKGELSAIQMQCISNQALMRANPEYFSLSAEDKEKYRANKSQGDTVKIERVILKALGKGVLETKEEIYNAYTDLSHNELFYYNWIMEYCRGIGDSYFFLNEYMDNSILDFNTVYDYDYADHLFQEEARKRDFPGYKEKCYIGGPSTLWSRMIINDQFYYVTITSVAMHIYDIISSTGDDVIDELLPAKLVPGANHGKRSRGGFSQWDMEWEAGGKEYQLKELRNSWYLYLNERLNAIKLNFKELPPAVYFETDNSDRHDPSRTIIINNATALRQIRWKQIHRDTLALERPLIDLEPIINEETLAAEVFIRKALKDIEKNSDTKVVNLERKHKVFVAPGAFDGVED